MKYHFAPKKGWMNDPNGLIYYKGKYHLFFQHNPHDIVWGPMHWGHASSDDLINWKEHEIALYPDSNYEDDGGCFSGSAIEKDGRLYLIYTSVSKEYGQSQSIAWSDDGINFVKYENNPVIKHFPEDATADFRDPKVFEYNGEYRMIVGTKYDNHGRIVQYKSKDLLAWEYVGVLFDDNSYDNVIECPDLFLVDGHWVLMYSMIGKSCRREMFCIGEYDGVNFVEKKRLTPEYGPQFYAAQSFEAKGKRILIGWLYDWDIKGNPNAKSAGAMTIPREVHVIEGEIALYPIEQAKELIIDARNGYKNSKVNITTKGAADGKLIINIKYTKTVNCDKEANCGQEMIFEREIIYDKSVESLDLLIDDNSLELFINKGLQNYSFNFV